LKESSALSRLLPALAACLLFATGAAAQPKDYPIGVILPDTGNAAFVGKSHTAVLKLAANLINSQGGIDGRPIALDFHDDETSPQVAVQITNALLQTRPAVMLGSSIVAMCNAEFPFIKARGPVDYCFSPGIHPAPGSYQFSIGVDTHEAVAVVFRWLRLSGLNRVATISSTDASGQEMEQGFDDALTQEGNGAIQLVTRQRFNLGDLSVAAQIERIKEANPQVVIAWTTGSSVVAIFKGLLAAGVNLPVVTSNGNMANDVMRQFADFLPRQLYVSSSEFPPHEGLYQLDPRVEQRQQQFYTALRQAGLPIDYMAAGVWDPLLLIADALHALGPDATAPQIRDWIAGQTDWPGTSGIYNFKAKPQRGLDQGDTVISTWQAAKDEWVPVSAPGGTPLKPAN
jgi:branched-chain amino acid transport system substrate-binding protein